MRKKRLIALLQILILVFLTGCTYNGYSGDRSDLYTVAINSVLWNNGHSFSADKYINPQIEIIDEDLYGRTMFTYHEKYYASANISFSALIICQASDEKDVFYYEDVNYIIKEQELYTRNLIGFEDEEIEKLKASNDWNLEINYDKCVKKEITTSKPTILYEKEIEAKIAGQFDLISGEYALFVNYLTSDSEDSDFIIYGYISKSDEDGIYFIGLVERDGDLLEELHLLVPLNVFDYKTEFIEFKRINNWK